MTAEPVDQSTGSGVPDYRAWFRLSWLGRYRFRQSWFSRSWAGPAIIVGAITVLGLVIRLYRLDSLPAEMWGDVTEHYALASSVMSGNHYLDYKFGGDGPLFSYIAALVAWAVGLSFYSLKLTTALIGTALIVAVYFYAETIFESRRIGYLAAFLCAVSFWSITFSRQAKPYILAPVFVALALTFAARRKPILTGVAIGLGMYTQAAYWGAPLLLALFPLAIPAAVVVAIPFISNLERNPSALLGSGSYIGSKLQSSDNTPLHRVLTILDNVRRNALSFNFQGDETFRHNIPGHPHLDFISGILFLLGMGLLVYRVVRYRDRRVLFWLIIPFLVLQIPSVMDQLSSDSPNMGRMTVILPTVLAATAYGIDWLICTLRRVLPAHGMMVSSAAGGALLVAIFVANMVNYFGIYPHGLPNNNTPFDLIIAQHIDASPPHTTSILVSCCWGDWGQPEPNAVTDRTEPGLQPVQAVDVNAATTAIQGLPAGSRVTLYLNPNTAVPSHLPLTHTHRSALRANGWQVAWVLTGKSS